MSDNRDQLLLKMYDQLFNDINRHITVIWQSISVVVGAFAVFALVGKNVISLDLANAIIILLVTWLVAHLYDAGYWYNRNLAMIANIERQFLLKSDLKDIHYYFGAHRPNNPMLTHLKIQKALGIGLGGLVILYHFIERVLPVFKNYSNQSTFDFSITIPYILLIMSICFLRWLRKNRNRSYNEFLGNSPGIEIDTTGIEYGVGHGFKNENFKRLRFWRRTT